MLDDKTINRLPGYTYEQMKADKKRFGALDGDHAFRCVKCKGRFQDLLQRNTRLCPRCR